MAEKQNTSLPVIANVSRVVTKVVDRITGDRVEYPLLVAAACVEGLRLHGVESRIMYGQVAWIEIMENQAVTWAGCWGDNISFWVVTQYGEIVDLNTSVAYRKQQHSNPLKALYSPPILWSSEVPTFYRYVPEGIAELELHEERDRKRYEQVLAEIRDKCGPSHLSDDLSGAEFPNEPIIGPDRKLLDDSKNTFRFFDRALSVSSKNLPPSPI